MRLTVGDRGTRPVPGAGIVVELPVELHVPAGFGTPSRHVHGTVMVTLRGKRDGAVVVDAEFVRGGEVAA